MDSDKALRWGVGVAFCAFVALALVMRSWVGMTTVSDLNPTAVALTCALTVMAVIVGLVVGRDQSSDERTTGMAGSSR